MGMRMASKMQMDRGWRTINHCLKVEPPYHCIAVLLCKNPTRLHLYASAPASLLRTAVTTHRAQIGNSQPPEPPAECEWTTNTYITHGGQG